MNYINKPKSGQFLFLVLAGIFIASLVSCNLIFQKFFYWTPIGEYTFELSVGILPYPITFLVTDLISEIFGRKRANQVVLAGLISSVFVLGVLWLADQVPAVGWSPVDDATFSHVFGATPLAVGASMAAYIGAQFIDVRLFHFWKQKTNGKHLWLRNNFSTFTSQLLDTSIVLLLLCLGEKIEWAMYVPLLINGWLFKVLVAALDTPVIYAVNYWVRKHFGLKLGEELSI